MGDKHADDAEQFANGSNQASIWKKARRLELDDGRVTLLAGTILLLVFNVVDTSVEWAGYHLAKPVHMLLELVRDLGIAAIVGGVVSLGIERISRANFQALIRDEIAEIKKNVVNAAYLKKYPEAYTQMLQDILIKQDFFRQNIIIIIDLIENNGKTINDSSPILYEITSSYWMVNISAEPKMLNPRMFLDNDWDGKSPELLEWNVGVHKYKGEAIKSIEKNAKNTTLQRWYEFPDGTWVEPGQSVHVFFKIRSFKLARDATTWCTLHPADRLNFTINHPPGYQVYAQAKTPARTSDDMHESDGRRIVIEIFKPLLPYTTVELGWRPHAPPNAESSADSLGNELAPRSLSH